MPLAYDCYMTSGLGKGACSVQAVLMANSWLRNVRQSFLVSWSLALDFGSGLEEHFNHLLMAVLRISLRGHPMQGSPSIFLLGFNVGSGLEEHFIHLLMAFPLAAAKCKGVNPYLFLASMSAPALRSTSTSFSWPLKAALCKRVIPFLSLASMPAPFLRKHFNHLLIAFL